MAVAGSPEPPDLGERAPKRQKLADCSAPSFGSRSRWLDPRLGPRHHDGWPEAPSPRNTPPKGVSETVWNLYWDAQATVGVAKQHDRMATCVLQLAARRRWCGAEHRGHNRDQKRSGLAAALARAQVGGPYSHIRHKDPTDVPRQAETLLDGPTADHICSR